MTGNRVWSGHRDWDEVGVRYWVGVGVRYGSGGRVRIRCGGRRVVKVRVIGGDSLTGRRGQGNVSFRVRG